MSKSFTWQQVVVLLAGLSACFAAHRYLGLTEGMAAGMVTSIVAFVMGRGDGPSPPAVPS